MECHLPENDLSLLIDAARASGGIAKRYWKQSPEIWHKDDNAGPVTEADLEVDRMLHAELLSSRPEYGWLSEETEDGSARLSSERVFIVDPIDGTRAFIAGEKTFSHSLAIAENGKVIAAVVYLPMLDLMFAATTNGEAQLNGAPITSTAVAIEGARILAARPTFNDEYWQSAPPPIKRHFRASLAYRMCLVAQGRFDGMLTLRDTWEWDIAAGSLIAERAGAVVSDRNGAAPVFNNPSPKLPGIIAAGKTVHQGLQSQLAPR